MTPHRPHLVVTLLSIVTLLALPNVRADDPPIDEAVIALGAFSAAPDQLHRWADVASEQLKSKQENDEATNELLHLLAHHTYHFHSDGRVTTNFWFVDYVAHRDGIEQASTITMDYTPWCDEKPTISARVSYQDGSTVETPATLAFEQPLGSSAQGVYIDDRRVALIVEGVREGAIVESRGSMVSRPILGDENSVRHALTGLAWTAAHSILITSDPGVVLKFSDFGSGVNLDTIETDDASQCYKAISRWPARFLDTFERGCGPDFSPTAQVLVSQVSSWEKLAECYATLVDTSIESGQSKVQSIVESAPKSTRNGSDKAKADWCLKQVASRVRYTSLSFGAQQIRPYSPDLVLQRGFGDCKDQATVYVALLRQMGVEAYVGLLDASVGLDLQPDIPSVDRFSHAIVFLPLINTWVDLTADLPVGMLPLQDRARRTLVCGLSGGRLIATPHNQAGDLETTETMIYRVDPGGGGEVEHEKLFSGVTGESAKRMYATVASQEALSYWQDYLLQSAGTDLDSLRYGALTDGSFVIRSKSERTQILTREVARTYVDIVGTAFVDSLPSYFVPIVNENNNYVLPTKRKHAFVTTDGYQSEYTLQVEYSAMCTMTKCLRPVEKAFGPISIKLAIQEGKTADLEDQRAGENELVEVRPRDSQGEEPSKAWVDAHDRYVQIKCTVRVQPGTMTAEQATELLEFVASVYRGENESGLVGQIEFIYNSLAEVTRFGSSRVQLNKYYDRVVDEFMRHPALPDPQAFFANILFFNGLQEVAMEIIRSVPPDAPDQFLARTARTALELKYALAPANDSKVDYKWLRELNSEAILELPASTLIDLDRTLLLDDAGHLRTDTDNLDPAIAQLQEHFSILQTQRTRESKQIFDLLAQAMLMARRDADLLNKVFAGPYPNDHATLAKLELLRNRAYTPSGITRRAVCRMLFTVAFSAARHDLVERLQQLYPEEMRHLPTQAQTLPTLDKSAPESVARWTIWLIEQSDIASARALFPEDTHDDDWRAFWVSHVTSGDSLVVDTLGDPQIDVSLALTETALAQAPAITTHVSEHVCNVTIQAFGDEEQDDFRDINLYLIEHDGRWQVLPNETSVAEAMLRAFDAGHTEEAAAWIDHIFPDKQFDLWSLFGTRKTATLAEQLANAVPKTEPIRTKLLLFAACAWRVDNATELENWLENENIALNNDQQLIVEQILATSFSFSQQFSKAYEYWWRVFERTKASEDLHRAVISLSRDQAAGGDAASDSKWKEPIEQRANEIDPNSELFRIKLLSSDRDSAFESLETLLSQNAESPWEIANNLLWTSLVYDEPRDKLLQRIELVDSLLDEEAFPGKPEFVHSLACAYAAAGQTGKAMHALSKIAANPQYSGAGLEVLCGLVAYQLGYHEHARTYFQGQTKRSTAIESGLIANHWLRKLDEQERNH